MVRPGISLYGYSLPFVTSTGGPSGTQELPLKPVLSWKTRIIDIREVAAGQRVGYNGAYTTTSPAKLATLAVGYGDGLSRQLSSKGTVLVGGEVASIVGKISMDVTTVDVTGVPGAQIGDEVVLIGEHGNKKLSAWDIAKLMQTIPYEVLCNISKRVPRGYVSS
jgi:alanine racemase